MEPETPSLHITIVTPCFNEADGLAQLRDVLRNLRDEILTDCRLAFVFVDDCSTDNTFKVLNSLFGEDADARVVKHDANLGIAGAMITGMREVSSEWVAVIDADCTFDPAQLRSMIRMLDNTTDVVCAAPLHPDGRMESVPKWRLSLSLGAAALYRLVMRQKMHSPTTCFRLYRRAALENAGVADTGFCGVTEFIARLDIAGHRIVEVPAVLTTRQTGHSKMRIVQTVGAHLRLITQLALHRCLGVPLPPQQHSISVTND